MLSHTQLPHSIVRAAESWKGLEFDNVPTFTSLETIFGNVVQFVVAISGVALFVMLLVGGFTFLFSGGDPKKLEQARGTITNAIIGLVVVVAAYIILRIIGVFTGTTGCLTTFQITSDVNIMNPGPCP